MRIVARWDISLWSAARGWWWLRIPATIGVTLDAENTVARLRSYLKGYL